MRPRPLAVAALIAAVLVGIAAGLVIDGTEAASSLVAAASALTLAFVTIAATDRRQERQLASEAKQHRERLAHERAVEDRAELRTLLDEAAVALHRSRDAQGKAQAAFFLHGNAIGKNWPQAIAELGTTGRAVDALSARLAIRLGRMHTATETYANAESHATTIYSAIMAVANLDDQELSDTEKTLDAAIAEFRQARHEFLDLAAQLVGVHLDSGPFGRAISDHGIRLIADVQDTRS